MTSRDRKAGGSKHAKRVARIALSLVSVFALQALLFQSPAVAANGDCGQPISSGTGPTSSDALAVLRTGVGLQQCDVCICDADGSGGVSATDALLVLRIAVGLSGSLDCPPCATTTTSSTTTTTMASGGFPPLTAGDFPGVSPCSDRDTPGDDPDAIAAITNATGIVWVTHETSRNTAGFPEMCGLTDIDNNLEPGAISWDPSNNAMPRPNFFTFFIADFFQLTPTGGGPEICQTGTDGTVEAMPRAGTYRKDFCVEGSGNAYDARVRLVVSGASVDKTFTELGINRFQLKACDGTTEIATRTDGIARLQANPGSIPFTIKSGSCSGGTEHLAVQGAVICIKKRSSACPAG